MVCKEAKLPVRRKRKYAGMLQQDTRAKLMKQLKRILTLRIQSNTRKEKNHNETTTSNIHPENAKQHQKRKKKHKNGERKSIRRNSRNE